MECNQDNRIILCKHVQAGQKPDVLFGSTAGTEVAVCFECADIINDLPHEAGAMVCDVICVHCAAGFGVPATLPGPLGWYDETLTLRQPFEDAA